MSTNKNTPTENDNTLNINNIQKYKHMKPNIEIEIEQKIYC